MPNHAIVLGLDRYATDLSSLDGPVADAQAFACWLLSSREVAAGDLRLGLLPGSTSPPEPPLLAACPRVGTTLGDIDRLLVGLYKSPPANIGRLYFFFSGHGAASSNPAYAQEAICLQGFAEDAWMNALELSSLLGLLNAVPARQRFIFIDGCRNVAYTDEVRFGALSLRPRPAAGQRRNYVMRATGPGRQAAEIDGRGLFARQLCEGLAGAGTAKRWDPAAAGGDGGYIVRWSALGSHVSAQVESHHAARRHEQLIYLEGEHPANEDPELAQFGARHFAPSKLAVRLEQPATPPLQTMVCLRRNDSVDDELSREMPASGQIEFDVPPSAWVLWARASGWRAKPKFKAVAIYAERVDESIALVPDEPATSLPADPRPGMSALPPGAGRDASLSIRVNGQPVLDVRPPVRVTVRRESGEVVVDPVTQAAVTLAPGVYRVRLDLPGGASTEASVLLSPGESEPLDLALPDITTPALARTLAAGHKPPPVHGSAMPSEMLGPLAAPSVATVAAIAVAQAVQAYSYGLGALGIGRRWSLDDAIGVEALTADERDPDTAPAHGVRLLPPRARLWRMRVGSSEPTAGRLVATHADVPIASASLAVEPGGYWLQFRDTDRRRRAGFKLATLVLAQHVTLVVRQQLRAGSVMLMQFAVRRDPAQRLQIQLGLVEGEALQRARAAGRDPLVDPTLRGLLRGDWFEPFSALLAASALLERGDDARAMFDALLAILAEREVRGPDVAVLKAAQAARDGDDARATALIRDALGMGLAPIVDALLEHLYVLARRLGQRGEQVDWIAEKLGQSVGHPLWTLRREDDKRMSGKPDLG